MRQIIAFLSKAKHYNKSLTLVIVLLITACSLEPRVLFNVTDTDFSKGYRMHEQQVTIDDMALFHGHLCDGLVVGALAMEQVMKQMYPNEAIDRTNLRVVSAPSPCLTDVAIYLTGGRYQFNTFYVDDNPGGIYIVQRIDDGRTFRVGMKPGVKPSEIDSLGALAVQRKLSPEELDYLKALEDDFTEFLLQSDAAELFDVEVLPDFQWQPHLRGGGLKTDVLNKKVEG